MRIIWKGSIGFGLVNIPIKLFAATSSKDIKFNYLHQKDMSPVAYIKKCKLENEEVSSDELVRGYQYEKGRHIVLSEQDFEALPSQYKKSINITDFVDLEQIDPIFFEKSYYLAPDETGIRPYALLMRTMQRFNKIAVGSVVIRNKESLAAVRVLNNVLVLSTMYYVDEINEPAFPELENVPEPHENELKMAENLISLLAGDFDPEKYHDTYREALTKIIDQKIEGKEIVMPTRPKEEKVASLMDALKGSVERAREEKEQRERKIAS